MNTSSEAKQVAGQNPDELLYSLNDLNAATAKLREELAIVRKDERQHWTAFEAKAVECMELRKQLAHQQPSADNQVDFHSDWDGVSPNKIQPVATTPDVEKIAREAVVTLQDHCIQLDPRIGIIVMRTALTQAREPLVKALKEVRLRVCGSTVHKMGDCMSIIDAALTGTEEKR